MQYIADKQFYHALMLIGKTVVVFALFLQFFFYFNCKLLTKFGNLLIIPIMSIDIVTAIVLLINLKLVTIIILIKASNH